MIKAVIFDCFGVFLADVLGTRIEAVRHTNPEAALALADIVRASNRGFITREESATKMAEIFGESRDDILQAADNGESKNLQLIELVKILKPNYKIGMLSNVRSRERVEQRFDIGELDSLFDAVVASGDVGYIKPEREIYEITAEKLGVSPSECVMIDDNKIFCDAAEEVGMRSICFTGADQAIADLTALIDSEKGKD